MPWIDLLRWLHVIGATVLFGTGAGIAFFMLAAHRTRDPIIVSHVASTVVVADMLFTATAAVLQPLSGYGLARLVGWPLTESWVLLSLGLYVFIGLFWLPVVWIQIRLRDLAHLAATAGEPLPPAYHRLFCIWFACGWPAFVAMLVILWLMTAKPAWQLLPQDPRAHVRGRPGSDIAGFVVGCLGWVVGASAAMSAPIQPPFGGQGERLPQAAIPFPIRIGLPEQ